MELVLCQAADCSLASLVPADAAKLGSWAMPHHVDAGLPAPAKRANWLLTMHDVLCPLIQAVVALAVASRCSLRGCQAEMQPHLMQVA